MLTIGTGVGGAAIGGRPIAQGASRPRWAPRAHQPRSRRHARHRQHARQSGGGDRELHGRATHQWTLQLDAGPLPLPPPPVINRRPRLWRRSVRALAAGVASLINVLDPEIVVIGGGIAAAGAALFDPLRQLLDEFEWRPHGATVRIEPARLGRICRRNRRGTERDEGGREAMTPGETYLQKHAAWSTRSKCNCQRFVRPRTCSPRRSSRGGWFTSLHRGTAGSWLRRCGRDTGHFPGFIRSSSCP